ncbi:hypothetical protein OR1_03883 [Geobacter sp. OR-1]|uniref:c-type cytochrome n=1 Tax=Geobacter sp. OR-1 TaxID=1266765 RepID=UPI000543A759|nr:cytochrome c [Geobacter sp. OR-1]GAM11567.1 hypothetical protein OR1_03883 [Geobacter sp. OR-1]
MKKSFSLFIVLSAFCTAAVGNAAAGISIERGKQLFENTKLGTTGKSCATCHPGGKKLEWAGTYDDDKLTEIANRCIQKALQGKPLKPDSEEMQSLILYLKSFAGPN